jgi:hypothetical protein
MKANYHTKVLKFAATLPFYFDTIRMDQMLGIKLIL